jgi:hypothetical protein
MQVPADHSHMQTSACVDFMYFKVETSNRCWTVHSQWDLNSHWIPKAQESKELISDNSNVTTHKTISRHDIWTADIDKYEREKRSVDYISFLTEVLVFKLPRSNACLFQYLYTFILSQRLFLWKKFMYSDQLWRKCLLMQSPFLESNYAHYHIKDCKKPWSKHIFLTLFKQHFLNLIIHRTLFSRNNY